MWLPGSSAPLPREGGPRPSCPASPTLEDAGPGGNRAHWGGTSTSDPKGDSLGSGSLEELPPQRKDLWGLRKREENAARSSRTLRLILDSYQCRSP